MASNTMTAEKQELKKDNRDSKEETQMKGNQYLRVASSNIHF